MDHPRELRYTRSDWWLRSESDGCVLLGLTAWKGNELGEVVFAELPEVGARVQSEQAVGIIESVKSVSELHSPLAGTIESVNMDVHDEPSLINADPYGAGWMLKMRPNQAEALAQTIERDEYVALRRIEE